MTDEGWWQKGNKRATVAGACASSNKARRSLFRATTTMSAESSKRSNIIDVYACEPFFILWHAL